MNNELRDALLAELMDISEPSEAVMVAASKALRKRMLREVALGGVGLVAQDNEGRRNFYWHEDRLAMKQIAANYKPHNRVALEINTDGTFMAVHCAYDVAANESGNWIEAIELPDLDIWLDEVLGPPKLKV